MVLSYRTGWTSPTKGGKNLGFDHFMMNEKTFMVNIKRQLKKQWKQVKTSFGHAGEFMTYDQVRDMFYLMNLDMSDGQFKELISEIGAPRRCCLVVLHRSAAYALDLYTAEFCGPHLASLMWPNVLVAHARC